MNAPQHVRAMYATPVMPTTGAQAARGNKVALKGGAAKSGMDGVTISIIVIASVLGATLIAVIAVVSANYQKSQCVKRYYRGEGVRLASAKRRFNLSPMSWSIGTFNRVLPGSASVVHGETFLLTDEDWRPYISRGDPVKVGPQVFMVSKDLSRSFTNSYVPLDTSTFWVDASGRQLETPGRLLGPSRHGVAVYTCDSCELPNNQWTGPRGGAIGYWDGAGVWHEGSCSSDCPYWYSPVWMGVACVQFNGPSPGTLAKVQSREMNTTKKEQDEDEKVEEARAAVRPKAPQRPVRAAASYSVQPPVPQMPLSAHPPPPQPQHAAGPTITAAQQQPMPHQPVLHQPVPHQHAPVMSGPLNHNAAPAPTWKGQQLLPAQEFAPPPSPVNGPDMAGFTRL